MTRGLPIRWTPTLRRIASGIALDSGDLSIGTGKPEFRLPTNPTSSLNLHDGLLPHLPAARTPRQSVRQSPREADAQGCD